MYPRRLKFSSTPSATQSLLVFLLLAAVAAPFAIGLAMTRGISHDEYQHLAAGALWAREGMLPYRDFPVLHMPYLAAIYGVLFQFTDHTVLAARGFAALCSAVIVALLGMIAFRRLSVRGPAIAWGAAFATTALCLSSDMFTQGAGRAWNQEPALLAALAAYLAWERGLESGRRSWLVFAGGLLGVTIGLRITYAPLIAPLGLATLLGGGPWAPRLRAAAAFSAGLLAGLGGVFFFAWLAPEAFFFGNFEFPKANIDYRMATGEPRTMTLLKKLRYFWKEVVRADVGFVIATMLPILLTGWLVWKKQASWPRGLQRFALALPFVLAGSLAPSPVFPQYFFPLMAFFTLAGLDALVVLPANSPFWRWAWRGSVLGVIVSLATISREYEGMKDILKPREWVGFELHEEAALLRQRVPNGRVLTLAPVLPLEAGLKIEPAFATGAFAWRVTPYISPEKAARLHLPTKATLDAYLDAQPADAVLVGFEPAGEEAFIAYAKKRGFIESRLEDKDERLWTAVKKSE